MKLQNVLELARKYAREGKVNLTKKELGVARELARTSNALKEIEEIEQLAYFFWYGDGIGECRILCKRKKCCSFIY